MDDELDFRTFLVGRIKERGFNLKKLSEVSGISIKYLTNLTEGNLKYLPPAPYLHGYLAKLAGILDFDREFWWERLKREESMKVSGRSDELPKNRFAKLSRRTPLALGGIAVLIIMYMVFRFSYIIGKPHLTVTSPSGQSIVVNEPGFILRGTVENGTTLEVNGEPVPIESGAWEKSITLDPGLNIFIIQAQKFLGSETEETRQIFYEPGVSPAPEPQVEEATSTEQ